MKLAHARMAQYLLHTIIVTHHTRSTVTHHTRSIVTNLLKIQAPFAEALGAINFVSQPPIITISIQYLFPQNIQFLSASRRPPPLRAQFV